MGDPKNTNVVTPNTSGAEEEAASIIADAVPQLVKRRRDDYGRSTEPAGPGKFQT